MELHPTAPSTPAPPAEAAARTSRREVLFVFAALAILLALELTVIQLPGTARNAVIVALVGLVTAKAALIALFFMHLKYETRILKLTVVLPFFLPVGYALALIADSVWRHLR